MNRLITEQQAQQLINYLGNKKYLEVFELIPMIMNLPKEEKEEKDKKEITKSK